MKREIKFRALYDHMGGGWKYGMLIYEGNVPRIQQEGTMLFSTCLKGTEGQFTGLKDKNGVDIYEDDMVRHNKNIYVVCFRDNMGMCFIDINKFDGGKDLVYNKDNWRDWLWVYNVRKYLEVIGNIHQTTQLLNQ